MAAAVISQPADTLLSKINKTKALPGESTTGRLIKLSGQLGVGGLFTGLGARYVRFCCWYCVTILLTCTSSLVMVGTLTAGQCALLFSLLRLLSPSYILVIQLLSLERSSVSSVPPVEWRSPRSLRFKPGQIVRLASRSPPSHSWHVSSNPIYSLSCIILHYTFLISALDTFRLEPPYLTVSLMMIMTDMI